MSPPRLKSDDDIAYSAYKALRRAGVSKEQASELIGYTVPPLIFGLDYPYPDDKPFWVRCLECVLGGLVFLPAIFVFIVLLVTSK